MSASNERREWHLTPKGWVRGSGQMDFGHEEEVPTPPDRVLTVEYKEYLSSMYSKMDKSVQEIWRSKDEATVTKLLKQFGEAPRKLF